MTIDLVVVGKLAIDELSFKGKSYPPVLGGSAAHVSLAAATVGSKVAIVSSIGEDFPEEFLKQLRGKGIDLSGVSKRSGSSSRFWANFNTNGSMTRYGLHFGVGNQFSLRHFSRLIKHTRAIHLGILPPFLQRRFIQRVMGQKKLLSMTTIFHQAKSLKNRILPQLPSLNLLFLNEQEAQYLTDRADTSEAIIKLGEMVPIVVVTKGATGCLINDNGAISKVPSFYVNQIDVTGAGDSFAGAFLASYLESSDLRLAAKWGNAAGAMNVQGIGCTYLIRATRQDLEEMINNTPT